MIEEVRGFDLYSFGKIKTDGFKHVHGQTMPLRVDVQRGDRIFSESSRKSNERGS
jgi:hypothetical protein